MVIQNDEPCVCVCGYLGSNFIGDVLTAIANHFTLLLVCGVFKSVDCVSLPIYSIYFSNKSCSLYGILLCTGGLFSSIFSRLWGTKERRILILGLDGAGKTTILYRYTM